MVTIESVYLNRKKHLSLRKKVKLRNMNGIILTSLNMRYITMDLIKANINAKVLMIIH